MRMVPGAAPRMGFTWRTSQYVTSPLSSPLSQLLQAASNPASSRVLPGTCSPRMAQADNHVGAGSACRVHPDVMLGRQLAHGKIPAGVPAPRRSGYPSELTKSCTCLGTSGSFAGAGTSWLFPGPATMPRRISSRRRRSAESSSASCLRRSATCASPRSPRLALWNRSFHVFPDRPALIQDNCALLSIPPPDLYFGGSEILGPLPERALKEQSVFLAGPHASEAFLFLVLLFQQTDKLLLAPVERLCGPRRPACVRPLPEQNQRLHGPVHRARPVPRFQSAPFTLSGCRGQQETFSTVPGAPCAPGRECRKMFSACVLKIRKEGSPVSSIHPLHGPAQGRGQHRPFVPVSQRFSEIFTGRPGGL